LITATFNSKYIKLTVIQCFAPTKEATGEKKKELQASKDKTRKHNICIIMGCFNTKVRSDNSAFEKTMGKHGLGERNDNSLKFVEFCSKNGMVMTGTIYRHKNIHKYI
jgi:hypothetical protein